VGSSGHNTFGDYQPAADGTTRCDNSIDAPLEDVARLGFYKEFKTLPLVGTPVRVSETLQGNRVIVEHANSGVAIGNLPTQFNYLPLCQKKGYRYSGEVTASRVAPVPLVEVHLDPL
jgi:hypothetical protein